MLHNNGVAFFPQFFLRIIQIRTENDDMKTRIEYVFPPAPLQTCPDYYEELFKETNTQMLLSISAIHNRHKLRIFLRMQVALAKSESWDGSLHSII